MFFKHIIIVLIVTVGVVRTEDDDADLQGPRNPELCARYTEQEMDQLALRLFTFGNSGRAFPENRDELNSFCVESLDILARFEEYTYNCIPRRITRTLMTIILATIKKRSTVLCDTSRASLSKRQQLLLNSAACSNAVKKEHQKCINIGINYAVESISIADFTSKIAHVCCNMPTMDTCMNDAMIRDKSGQCSSKRAQDAMDFLDSMSRDAMNFLCRDFNPEENDMCDSYLAPANPAPPAENYYFYLLPLIKSLAII